MADWEEVRRRRHQKRGSKGQKTADDSTELSGTDGLAVMYGTADSGVLGAIKTGGKEFELRSAAQTLTLPDGSHIRLA